VYRGPFPSGAPGIFIDQAAQLGSQSIFVGAVGDDPFGAVILDRLSAHGVATDLIARVSGIPAGSAFVSYNDDDSRDFVCNIAQSAASRFDTSAYVIEKLSAFGLDFMHVSGSALADPEMARKNPHALQGASGDRHKNLTRSQCPQRTRFRPDILQDPARTHVNGVDLSA
jgi:sugar/nucleoside kinase (ribokinase family)